MPPSDLATIRDMIEGPVETHEVPDLRHILWQHAGPPSLSGYKQQMREPVDPGLVTLVVTWVGQRVVASA